MYFPAQVTTIIPFSAKTLEFIQYAKNNSPNFETFFLAVLLFLSNCHSTGVIELQFGKRFTVKKNVL